MDERQRGRFALRIQAGQRVEAVARAEVQHRRVRHDAASSAMW
jgi:hypothetical protein